MTNILKKMTREDVTNTEEYQLTKLSMEWLAEHDDDDVDALDGYEAGYKQALEHPTGGELLYVLNKGAAIGRREMLDKACEWLKYNFNMPDDFEIHFRKAMEEQQ